jgi:DNA-binding transcriptional MocR family regulator
MRATLPPMIPSRPTGAALWTTRLDRGSPESLSRQLAAALRQSIAEGSLAAGARLPSIRALAAELSLARSTVVGVFEQLTAEGYIIARPGSAHRVPERCEHGKASGGAFDGGGADRRLSRRPRCCAASQRVRAARRGRSRWAMSRSTGG